jgi:hypothetical protein
MSLVGSHIEVHGSSSGAGSPYADPQTPRARGSAAMEHVEDLHPPISPKSSSEEYFLGAAIDTQSVSASVLSEQLYLTLKHARSGTTSAEDFVTALDHEDFMTATNPDSPYNFSHKVLDPSGSSFSSFPGKDSLAYETPSPNPEFYTPRGNRSSSTAPTRTTYEINPAEKAYVTAKDVWGWGKTVKVFKPFLGLAEGVAGKVASVVGSSMSDLDSLVVANLTKVDDKILNPAIGAIVKVVFSTMQKTEDFLKPVITAVLKPIGLVKNKAENPEVTTSYKSAVTPS